MVQMPQETPQAIEWALTQTVVYEEAGFEVQVTKDTPHELVDKVREYFNNNDIEYSSFSYDDLIPYLPN